MNGCFFLCIFDAEGFFNSSSLQFVNVSYFALTSSLEGRGAAARVTERVGILSSFSGIMSDDIEHRAMAARWSDRGRLARNSIWNTIGWGGVVFISFATLPVTVRLLGDTQYGLFALVMSVVAPLGVLDFGMSDATVKYLAESIGKGDMAQAKRYAHSSLAFSAVVGLLGAVVIVAIAPLLATRVFNIEPENQGLARTSIRWVGVLWCFMQVRQTLMGVVTALQRYDLLALGTVVTHGSTIGIGLWILAIGGQLPGMLRGQALTGGACAVGWLLLAWWLFRPIGFPFRVDAQAFRHTFSFGFWQMINTFGGILSYQSQRWLLGILLPIRTVGYYNISQQIVNMAYMASYKVGQVLFPEVSRMQGRGEEREAAHLSVNASWLLTGFSALLFVPLAVFAHDILRIYLTLAISHELAAAIADQATSALRILAIGTAVGCVFAVPSFYLLGTGRSRWLAAMSILYGSATLVGCVVFIPMFGIKGAALAMTVGTAVHVMVLIVLWARVLRRWLPGRVYAASTFGPLVIGIGIAALLIFWRDALTWEPGWIVLGGCGIAVAALSGLAIVAVDRWLPGGADRRGLMMRVGRRLARGLQERLPWVAGKP
jgi:O-antigen/teichoic acid export membrane protein